MTSFAAAEQWLSRTTGGHPVLVPALLLAGTVILLVLVVDFLVRSLIHPALEKLRLRSRGRALKALRSTTSASAGPEGRIVVVSPTGQCFLTLLPGHAERGPFSQEPVGKAYKVHGDGQIHELWRVEGWDSSHECFLSDDGRYLIRVIDWSEGSTVKDLAIAFYDRGELLRQHFTSDLVTSERNWLGWISRGGGLSESEAESSSPAFDLSEDNTFRMITSDRITYAFDVRTGEIIPADVRPEPDGIHLHKAVLVAGACVAAAGVGVLLALTRRRLK